MDCGFDNCLECTYPDCICDQASIMKKSVKRKKSPRSEYDEQYYQKHKEEKKAKALERYRRNQKRGHE